jgi:DNA-binding response OmpR family regulator
MLIKHALVIAALVFPGVTQAHADAGFYVDPDSSPALWVRAHQADPRAPRIAESIANVPMARWFGSLLNVLVRHPMETLSRSRLLTLWYGTHADVTERGIDVPIWRLRQLIEDDPSQPRIIQTMRGIGYMFVPPRAPGDAPDAERDA